MFFVVIIVTVFTTTWPYHRNLLAGGEASKALTALKALDAAERMEVPSAVVTKAHQWWGEQPCLEGGGYFFDLCAMIFGDLSFSP